MKFCPIHASPLTDNTRHAISLQQCSACAGIWLPAATVAKALGAVVKPAALQRAGHATTLRCPDDGAQLAALHHHGVEIDLCTACGGVWLDQGELERILQQRKGYGLADAAADVAANAVDVIDVAELSSDAVSAVFEVLGELLSGL